MWRKFNRSRDPAIGSPTLIETTFDQQYLDTIPEVDSLRSSGGPSSVNSPGLPELPFKAVEPLAPPNRPVADHRASSVYSQPGQETLRIVPQSSDRMLSVYSEVSPLTSPRPSTDLDQAESPDVSPIEPRPPASQDFPTRDPKPRTQLPLLRKVSPAEDSANPESKASLGGRRSSAEGAGSRGNSPPVELSKEERLTMLREKNRKLLSGFQERPSTKNKETTRPRREDSLDHPAYREPWKGASGRTTLVEPVRNVPRSKHDVGPLPKRRSVVKDSSAHTFVTVPAARSTSAEPTSSPTSRQQLEFAEPADEPIKPTAPLKVGNNTTRIRSPVTAENLSGPFNPRYSDATVSSYEPTTSDIADGSRDGSKVIPSTSPQHEPTNTSSETTNNPRPPTSNEDPASRFSWTTSATTTPPPKTPENDPRSHFSWTTYAPSVHESPGSMAQRDTEAPPVPPIPYIPNAMAMRKRTIPANTADPNAITNQKINRKPTPSNINANRSSSVYSSTTMTTATEANKSPTGTMLTSPADRSKSLPQCPPELEAKDRIAALEARMEVLVRRRGNINQILKELKNVVQPTSFAYDLATKEEVKKTVKGLEDELSEIRVEEHQIGMILHRALKKRDQENVYGYPTGLWIKRVTS